MKHKFSWMNDALEVRETEKHGKGVFANKHINKDEILFIFGGYVMTRHEEERLPDGLTDNAVQVSDNFVIGITKEEIEGACYVNHSCNPNSGFKGQIFLVAMRPIIKSDEVTFDYGMVLWKTKGAKRYRLKCFCGAENCRGFVTDEDWRNPTLQQKYDGYFQWYLQEKITNHKSQITNHTYHNSEIISFYVQNWGV